MSHLLQTDITNAAAMQVPRCIYSGMSWKAEGDYIRQKLFDKQTRFLGNGMELAAVAIRNKIPRVTWYSENKVPLKDIKWIAGQYYATICRYMNIPVQQKSLYEKIKFVTGLWCTKSEKEQFVIVEDEFHNMFSMMRAFLSRGKEQSFVNVFSENYLLRDYMRCNQQMFLSNPDVIPVLSADYAKTERNVLIKLILMMTAEPVSEPYLKKELEIAGCKFYDTQTMLLELLNKYTYADSAVIEVKGVEEGTTLVDKHLVNYFYISRENFDRYFAASLKNAYFIVEDEQREKDFIDVKLFGHVTQTILPGQLVVYDGKYYEVKQISPQNGVILRRASDLYDGRKFYRQIRTYHAKNLRNGEIFSHKKIMGMEVMTSSCDFSVETSGYLDMKDGHDLRMAKVVDLQQDPGIHDCDRNYKNKKILRIKLPDTDENIRFTLCLLLSELFKSVFPNGWQYLAVLTPTSKKVGGMLQYMTYLLVEEEQDGEETSEIYILEDSELDLGLLDAVRRNLPRLFEILADFLDWHFEKMHEPEVKDPVPVKFAPEPEKKTTKEKKSLLKRIRSLFKNFEKKEKKEEKEQEKKPGEVKEKETKEESKPEYTLESDQKEQEARREETDLPDTEGLDRQKTEKSEAEVQKMASGDDSEDIFDNDGMTETESWMEDAFEELGITGTSETRYQKECFLKFGFDEIDKRLKIEEVRRYLHVRGFSNSALTKARKREILDMKDFDLKAVNTCDFCGLPLSGVSYERLNDGRIRCNDCSASAIETVEELEEIFYRVLNMLEIFYGIKIQVPVSVQMTDAKTIAKRTGAIFKPQKQFAVRVIGFAQKSRGKYSILIENGSPRLAAISTLVHELVHIWQYIKWEDYKVVRCYKMNKSKCTARARDIVYEGMAVWASIQYLYQIGETYYAAQQEAISLARRDVYGAGFYLYAQQYPLVKDMSMIKCSPFDSFPPLDPAEVMGASRMLCEESECKC